MLFYSDKPEKNGPKVETKLRKEFGASQPLSYETEIEGQYRPNSVGQALGDVGAALFSGGARPLYTFRFDVDQPRPCEVRVHVIKAGGAVALGSLLYTTTLRKPVPGPVNLEDAKTFSKSRFIGEPGLSARLNANSDLIKRINKFVRTSYQVGQEKVSTARFLQIKPYNGGSLLAINTLPRSKWMGLSSTFDATEFLAIADALEVSI